MPRGRNGASHGTLVPLHSYPLWFFFASSFFSFFVCVCVLYYKFIFYITRGAPNKAMKKKKKIPTISMVLKGPHKTTEMATNDPEMG